MAYKDILVFLDPTAEAAERARFAAGLAKSHGARLIAVDISRPANAEGIDPGSAIRRMFADATRDAGISTIFAPAEQPEEGEALSHCVDLMIAPGPDSLARDVIRHGALDRALLESRRSDADAAAGLEAGPGRRQHRHRLERRTGGLARRP